MQCDRSIIVRNSRRLGAPLRWIGLHGPISFLCLAIEKLGQKIA